MVITNPALPYPNPIRRVGELCPLLPEEAQEGPRRARAAACPSLHPRVLLQQSLRVQ